MSEDVSHPHPQEIGHTELDSQILVDVATLLQKFESLTPREQESFFKTLQTDTDPWGTPKARNACNKLGGILQEFAKQAADSEVDGRSLPCVQSFLNELSQPSAMSNAVTRVRLAQLQSTVDQILQSSSQIPAPLDPRFAALVDENRGLQMANTKWKIVTVVLGAVLTAMTVRGLSSASTSLHGKD